MSLQLPELQANVVTVSNMYVEAAFHRKWFAHLPKAKP